ncbi:MAG: hypothetical protein H6797_05925 [Candidatus Nomurabacteria bacterium]|nr:MAG: hypothetical protein H6797_05925 [Candidatus Nomurabacteria bacterium]
MSLLNKQFLQSLGIELDDQTFEAFDEHFEATLQERVVDAIVDGLDEQQLEQLSAVREQGGDAVAMQTWLQANVPDLSQIVQSEVDILLGDLAESGDHI